MLSSQERDKVIVFFIENGYFDNNLKVLLSLRVLSETIKKCIECLDSFWLTELEEFSSENIAKYEKLVSVEDSKDSDNKLDSIINVNASLKQKKEFSNLKINKKLLDHYKKLNTILQAIDASKINTSPFDRWALVQIIDNFIEVGTKKYLKYSENKKYNIVNINNILFYTIFKNDKISFQYFENSDSKCSFTMPLFKNVDSFLQNASESGCLIDKNGNIIDINISEKMYDSNEIFCNLGGTVGLMKTIEYFIELPNNFEASSIPNDVSSQMQPGTLRFDESQDCISDVMPNVKNLNILQNLILDYKDSVILKRASEIELIQKENNTEQIDNTTVISSNDKTANQKNPKLYIDWIGNANVYTIVDFQLLPCVDIEKFHKLFNKCLIDLHFKDFKKLYTEHEKFINGTVNGDEEIMDDFEEFLKTKKEFQTKKIQLTKLSNKKYRFPLDLKIIVSATDCHNNERMYWSNNSDKLFCLSNESFDTALRCIKIIKTCNIFKRCATLKNMLLYVSTWNQRWDQEFEEIENLLNKSIKEDNTVSIPETRSICEIDNSKDTVQSPRTKASTLHQTERSVQLENHSSSMFELKLQNLYRMAKKNNENLFKEAENLLRQEKKKLFQ